MKKRDIKSLAEASIKILRSGKVKVKEQKINLLPFIDESLENSVVSRLNGIISKEDVVIDTSDIKSEVNTTLTDELHTIELMNRFKEFGVNINDNTVIITTTKNKATKLFDFLNDDIIGILLRTSTLGSIYTNLSNEWTNLNKNDTTNFTNVLYIPKIMIFIDPRTGRIKNYPTYLNLLVISTPKAKDMTMNINTDNKDDSVITEVVPNEDEQIARVIADIVDSVIVLGIKNIVLSPFSGKILSEDKTLTSKLWSEMTSSQRFIEHIERCMFAVNDDHDYVVFTAARSK